MTGNLDIENMSDEDFLSQYAAGPGESPDATPEPQETPETAEPKAAQEQALSDTPAPVAQEENLFDASEDTTLETALDGVEPVADKEEGAALSNGSPENAEASTVTPDHTKAEQTKSSEQKPEETPASKTDGEQDKTKADDAAEPATEKVDFEASYKELMAPFKANGAEFNIRSPEEARRLMQMGANYTKKMQELQPNLKQMRALQNNGLLDDEKLNFLIDLSKHDKNAIQKLLHESGVDPLDLDVQTKPAYQPGNHQITDQEQAFYATLDEVQTSSEGMAILSDVNTSWDQQSKQALFHEPNLLTILTAQKETGIYDQISEEVSRQKTLGQIGAHVPFLDAYKHVGDTLHAAGKLTPKTTQAPASSPAPQPTNGNAAVPVAGSSSTSPAPQPLETRPATARSAVPPNGDKAAAAAAARPAPPQPPTPFNPLAMTDEEILAMGSPSS